MHIFFAHCSLMPCSCQPINFIYRVCECLELQFMNKEFCWSWFNYVSRVVNYNFLQFFFFPHANEFFFVFLLNWLMHFAWITINCHRSSVSRSFGFKVLTIYFVFLRLFFYSKIEKIATQPFPSYSIIIMIVCKWTDLKRRYWSKTLINSELWHKRLKIWTNVWKINHFVQPFRFQIFGNA